MHFYNRMVLIIIIGVLINVATLAPILQVEWLSEIWRPDSFFKNAKSVTFQVQAANTKIFPENTYFYTSLFFRQWRYQTITYGSTKTSLYSTWSSKYPFLQEIRCILWEKQRCSCLCEIWALASPICFKNGNGEGSINQQALPLRNYIELFSDF